VWWNNKPKTKNQGCLTHFSQLLVRERKNKQKLGRGVPDVIGTLPVWIQNQKKKRDEDGEGVKKNPKQICVILLNSFPN